MEEVLRKKEDRECEGIQEPPEEVRIGLNKELGK
jgi:hypothetical protein